MGGGSTQDYSSLPVYDSQADVDYATSKGLLKNGDSVRIGNSIYQLDRDAGWGHMRTFPPGTFPSATDASNNGILNPLPTGTPVTDGITATGGITDPNYKALGEYLVGPTYTGPTTDDEYVMQRAGGPAWDYDYPMYLGAGGYGPGNTIPTVDSRGNWTVDGVGTDTTTDSITTTDTTDTTDTTTTESETADVRDSRAGPEYGWGPGQTDPIFPNTWPGIVNYNQRVEDMGPVEAFGLLAGLQRTGQGLGGFVDPSAPYASPLSPENFNPLSLGGAGDPGWAPESTIKQEVWDEGGIHKSFKSFDQFTQEELGKYGWKSYSDIPDNLGSGMMIDVQHHQGQTKGSSFLGMLQNAIAKTEGSTAWSPEKVTSTQAAYTAPDTKVQQVIDIPSNVTWSPAAQPVAPQTAPQVATVADIGLEAARQAASSQQAQAQAARDRVAAAQEVQRFMQTRAYQEEGASLTPAMRDALAAGQVDTFAGGGEDRGMGNFGGEQGMWT